MQILESGAQFLDKSKLCDSECCNIRVKKDNELRRPNVIFSSLSFFLRPITKCSNILRTHVHVSNYSWFRSTCSLLKTIYPRNFPLNKYSPNT